MSKHTHVDPETVRDDVTQRLRTEGLSAAYEGALGVLRDPKAPAPAKATCAMMFFRANNMLDKEPDPTAGKESWEMTRDEMTTYIRRAEAERARLEAKIAASDGLLPDASDETSPFE